jgi:hypothetical protein
MSTTDLYCEPESVKNLSRASVSLLPDPSEIISFGLRHLEVFECVLNTFGAINYPVIVWKHRSRNPSILFLFL